MSAETKPFNDDSQLFSISVFIAFKIPLALSAHKGTALTVLASKSLK